MSCHKSGDAGGAVSLNVVNAMAKSTSIIPVIGSDAGISFFKTAQTVTYGNAQFYSPWSGANPLYIASGADSSRRLYSGNFNLAPGKIYSFFLAGDTTKPDTLFIQDEIPVYSDSAAGIRLVNLMPDSKGVKVNITGNASTQTEFSDLGYRQSSSFKKYAATGSVSGSKYIFEVRNQADSLLATYTWSYTRYKNNTLVLAGSAVKGSGTVCKVFLVKNY
jgi:hypothetical protein